MNWLQRISRRPFFIKLFNWEYWSFNAVYLWIMPVWVWLAIRARSFFFFSAANPSIENGGFLMESKKKIYDIIPAQYYPRTIFFPAGTAAENVLQQLEQQQFVYPLVGKPDIGGRGRGVLKIKSEAELIAYTSGSPLDYLVQEYADQPNEVGVFYYRYPGDANGHISGIVKKELLSVTGDGTNTIYQLLQKDKRFILQLEVLEKLYGEELNNILPAGEEKELVPYGNHARGAKFLDDTRLADDVIEKTIDAICKQVEGFYFGRLDIRYNSWEDLRQGKNISIIELNGAGSEPTHMYDPSHSLFFAWKEIIRHWVILWRISRANHKNGIPYLSRKDGLKMMRDNKAFEQKMGQLYA